MFDNQSPDSRFFCPRTGFVNAGRHQRTDPPSTNDSAMMLQSRSFVLANGRPTSGNQTTCAPHDGVEKCVWALRKGEVVADRILRG